MLSIIICSISKDFFDRFEKSLIRTIEIPYEIVVINNDVERLSLSKAYNKGGKMSKFDYLLFVHEDVEFLQNCWGEKLIRILKDIEVGIVGIAGSTYLPSVPSGWYLPKEGLNNVFIHQGFKYKEASIRIDNEGEDMTPVFLLDGVFLAMRKNVWEEFPFNENLDGFHAYDIDISQRVSTKYKNIFTKQVSIIHHSEGKVDKHYFDSILAFKKGFKNFKYPNRNYDLELILIKQLYMNLRCYYDKVLCVKFIKPFVTIKNLGIVGYFLFLKYLRYAK